MRNDDRPGGMGAGRAAEDRRGVWRAGWRGGLLAAALACVAPLAAACASGPAHPGASADGGGAGALAYSRCMRAHGIKNFPDPNSQGGIGISASSGINPSSPQFAAANQACQPKMPGGHLSPARQARMQARMLEFAQCMRTHGEPGYPDPNFGANGMVTQKISKNSGVDPSSPQFQAAQKACQHIQGPGPAGKGSLTTSG